MLEMVKSAAYLGLEMDEKLDWSPHINKVTAKATRSLNFIRRNLQIGSQSVKSSSVPLWTTAALFGTHTLLVTYSK